jgi:hypothetical protein
MTNTKDIKHSKWWYDYDRNSLDRPNPFESKEEKTDEEKAND